MSIYWQIIISQGESFNMKKQRVCKHLGFSLAVISAFLLVGCTGTAEPNNSPVYEENTAEIVVPITLGELEEAQIAWGAGLVGISTAYANGEDYVSVAVAVLEDLYGYNYGPVLFKPTIASDVPFRFDWDGAASYFIGTSAPVSIPEDGTGFATNAWTAVNFQNDWEFIINGETAIGMGTVVLTDGNGEEVRVEKSMGWFRDPNGDIRLQLHHSSVPFTE